MRPQDFKIKMSKKDCQKGYHAFWKKEVDNDLIRGEVCGVCGVKVEYHKLAGKMDERKYMQMHKVDFLQPWNPDGTRCREFWEYYGNPHEYNKKDEKLVKEINKPTQ